MFVADVLYFVEGDGFAGGVYISQFLAVIGVVSRSAGAGPWSSMGVTALVSAGVVYRLGFVSRVSGRRSLIGEGVASPPTPDILVEELGPTGKLDAVFESLG